MQGRERPRIQLTVRRKGESNIVTLDTGGPMVYESETRVDETLLRGLVSQLIRLVTPREDLGKGGGGRGDLPGGEASVTVRRLQVIGEQIFSQLLPEPARKLLRDAAPSDLFLHMDEQLIQVPWELCHDGADFLVIKFRMGRYVRVPRQVPLSGTAPVQPGLLKVLLIADPTESLPQAAQEAEQLCKLLDGIAAVKVTLIGGKLVGKAELLTNLQAHDIVHFAGHSHYDPVRPSRSGWHLHEGVLTAEELRNLSRPPLLVFSNSCQAGATAAWGGRYQYDEQAFGIGSAFLVSGVRNYIGTFWVVHDEESRDFGVVFYNGLASGLSLGEALLKARLEIRDQKGGERLTWASYMLYGDPAMTPFPVTAQPVAPSPPVRIERRLVAILHADVKGYSRQMQEDEEATARTVNAYLKVMSDLTQEHHGEVKGTPAGDNLLALFPSTTGAVSCAVEIQRELKRRNAELPANHRIEFRIGISLGEVRVEGATVHGEGVNLAALLQHEVAEPGGICISEAVYGQVKNKPGLALTYEDLGEKYFEKIAKPVRAYRVLLEPGISPQDKRVERERPFSLLRLVGGITLIILAVVLWEIWGIWGAGQGAKKSKPKPIIVAQAVVVRPVTVIKIDSEHAWMPAAISVYLSSQLSRVPNLTVYPGEHFDFLVQQGKASYIKIAKQLGITKVIQVSFLVGEGSILLIEAHLEDVEPPVQGPSEEVRGKQEEFLDLIRELSGKLTKRLDLQPVKQPEVPSSASGAFKLMLEGEGEVSPALPQPETPPAQGPLQKPADQHSWIPLGDGWLEASVAWAEEAPLQSHTPEAEIRYALEKYRQAYEKRDLVMLEDVYATFTTAQRQANTEYFQNTQNLRVAIRDVVISVSGDEAAVSYTREDEFLDAKTGQKVKLDARFTKIFVRQDDVWKISVGKK